MWRQNSLYSEHKKWHKQLSNLVTDTGQWSYYTYVLQCLEPGSKDMGTPKERWQNHLDKTLMQMAV